MNPYFRLPNKLHACSLFASYFPLNVSVVQIQFPEFDELNEHKNTGSLISNRRLEKNETKNIFFFIFRGNFGRIRARPRLALIRNGICEKGI